VIALEPSAGMLAQRPAGSAPAVRGVAEHLPFAPGSFDAVLACLTIHHWGDWRQGVKEMLRVVRQRVVVLTFDPDVSHDFWLVRDYFPAIAEIATEQEPLAEVQGFLRARVEPVPVPADCHDGFLACYWKRPGRYLDPAVRRSISSFHALSARDIERGLRLLANDLESGVWASRHAALLDAGSFDGGYRLLISEK
jgi:SAM-dependent methyltransferase